MPLSMVSWVWHPKEALGCAEEHTFQDSLSQMWSVQQSYADVLMGSMPLHCTDVTFLDKKIKITVVHKILAMFHRLTKTILPTFWWSFKGNISNIIFSLDTEQYFSYNWLLGQHLGQIPEQNIFLNKIVYEMLQLKTICRLI